jgi:DNA-binding NarL/FixJ family response regulator
MSACVSRFSAWRPRASTKSWSSEEVATLRQLAEAGESIRIIALHLRRTESAVRNKAGMHGISLAVKSATG